MIQPTVEDLSRAVQEEEQSANDYDTLALTFDGMRLYDASNALKHMAHDERRHANNLRAIIEMLQMQGSDSGILSKAGQMLAFVPIPQAQALGAGMMVAGKVIGADSGGRQMEWPYKEIPWGDLEQMAHDVREARWGIENRRALSPEGLPLSLEHALQHLKDLEAIIERHRGYGTDSTSVIKIPWDDVNAMWNTVESTMQGLVNFKITYDNWMRTMMMKLETTGPAQNPYLEMLETVNHSIDRLEAVVNTLALYRGT